MMTKQDLLLYTEMDFYMTYFIRKQLHSNIVKNYIRKRYNTDETFKQQVLARSQKWKNKNREYVRETNRTRYYIDTTNRQLLKELKTRGYNG